MVYASLQYLGIETATSRCLSVYLVDQEYMRGTQTNLASSVEHYQNSTYKVDLDRPHHNEEPQVQLNLKVVQVILKVQDQQAYKLVSETCLRYLGSASEHQPKHDSSIQCMAKQ